MYEIKVQTLQKAFKVKGIPFNPESQVNVSCEDWELCESIQSIQNAGGTILGVNKIKETYLEQTIKFVEEIVKKHPKTGYLIQENERGVLVVPLNTKSSGEVYLLESKIDNLSYCPNFKSPVIKCIYGKKFYQQPYDVNFYLDVGEKLNVFGKELTGPDQYTRTINFRLDLFIKYLYENKIVILESITPNDESDSKLEYNY